MDALRTARDLLATKENVVAVRDAHVVRAGHRVEGAQHRRELVDNVELNAVALLHNLTEQLLVRRGDVVEGVEALGLGEALVQQCNGLAVAETQRRGLAVADKRAVLVLALNVLLVDTYAEPFDRVLRHAELEGLAGVLRGDVGDELGVFGEKALEHTVEQRLGDVEDLVVVVVNDHLHVEADELRQVAVGVGVLGAEHRGDLEHAGVHVALKGHLLVQLRGLREEGGLAEVVQLEDAGTRALGGGDVDLRRVDLREAQLRAEELAPVLTDAALDLEDGHVRWGAVVEPARVEARVGVDAHIAGVGGGGIDELEGQHRLRVGDDEDGLALELHLGLRRAGDLLARNGDLPRNLDDCLEVELSDELDHILRDHVADREDDLNSREVVTQHEEGELALGAGRVNAGAHGDDLAIEFGREVVHVGVHRRVDELRGLNGRGHTEVGGGLGGGSRLSGSGHFVV
eukprot:PhM_4_TR14805/c0_g1_i1/m.89292